MRKRNKTSRRSGRQGNQTIGRKAFKVERLEDRRMLAGNTMTFSELEALINNIVPYTYEECQNDKPCSDATFAIGHDTDAGATAWKTTVEAGYDPTEGKGASLFVNLATELGAAESAGEDAVESAEDTGLAIANYNADPNTPGWKTGFTGIPYINLEDTTPGGEDDGEEGDGDIEYSGFAKAIGGAATAVYDFFANLFSGGSEGEGDGTTDGTTNDDGKTEEESEEEGNEETDEESNEESEGGTEGDEDDDDEEKDEDEEGDGDGQSRQTEDSRDTDPRRSGSGPDPRQGGLGRPGSDSKTDPTPYRGLIVQGGNSDPSDPDSGRSGPGVGPEHPSYGAIDYGPDGKPVDYQGYLPPKDLLVQGGDSDPPKNSEHMAVDALFNDLGAEHAGAAVEAPVAKETGEKSVDLENQTGLQANQEMVRGVRSMCSSQFENSNQKATQYINMLSSVLRKMNEMGNGVVKNLT